MSLSIQPNIPPQNLSLPQPSLSPSSQQVIHHHHTQVVHEKGPSLFSIVVAVCMVPTIVSSFFLGGGLGLAFAADMHLSPLVASTIGAVSGLALSTLLMKTIQISGDCIIDGTLYLIKLPFKVIYYTTQALCNAMIYVVKLPFQLLYKTTEGNSVALIKEPHSDLTN